MELFDRFQLQPEGRPMTAAAVIGFGLAIYAVAGILTALAFVSFGVDRALVQPASFTLSARMILLPGAAMLWPYILVRWIAARNRR
jgi:hypothetical protein